MNNSILVLEDETPLLDAITAKLTNNGFKVLSARNVKDSLKYLENGEEIDAFWLDHYLLGEKTGLDFVKTAKTYKKYHKTPMFLVSNTATDTKIKDYLQNGVIKSFVKSNSQLDNIFHEIKEYICR